MKLLVTGSRGFIGRRVMAALKESGLEASELPAGFDVCSLAEMDERAETVLHLAGRNQERDFQQDPYAAMRTNVFGTFSVLEYCKRHGARLVFASTSGVYEVSASRTSYAEDAPVRPGRAYPASKAVAEDLCARYARSGNASVIILRLFNVYGSGQQRPFLIPDILESLRANASLPVRMPDAVRDFVHVDDAAAAFVRAATHPGMHGLHVYNIGSGQGTAVRDVVSMCEQASGRRAILDSAPADQKEVSSMTADITKARRELNWNPSIALADGIARTWDAMAGAAT